MFKWIKRIIFFVLTVMSIYLGITFTSENNQSVSLTLFGNTLPELTLGLWIVIILLLGIIIGLILALLTSTWRSISKDR